MALFYRLAYVFKKFCGLSLPSRLSKMEQYWSLVHFGRVFVLFGIMMLVQVLVADELSKSVTPNGNTEAEVVSAGNIQDGFLLIQKIDKGLNDEFFEGVFPLDKISEAYRQAQEDEMFLTPPYLFSDETSLLVRTQPRRRFHSGLYIDTLDRLVRLEAIVASEDRDEQLQLLNAWREIYLQKFSEYVNRNSHKLKKVWSVNLVLQIQYDSNVNRSPEDLNYYDTNTGSGQTLFAGSGVWSPWQSKCGWKYSQTFAGMRLSRFRFPENETVSVETEPSVFRDITHPALVKYLSRMKFSYRARQFMYSGNPESRNVNRFFWSNRLRFDLYGFQQNLPFNAVYRIKPRAWASVQRKSYSKEAAQDGNALEWSIGYENSISYTLDPTPIKGTVVLNVEGNLYKTDDLVALDYTSIAFSAKNINPLKFLNRNISVQETWGIESKDNHDTSLRGDETSTFLQASFSSKLVDSYKITGMIRYNVYTYEDRTNINQYLTGIGVSWSY